ncbi:MAG: PIN domain-containing protein [Acidobacteria bacterium]|nr:PIN domain-containing protein [Acidobacteriota bacterium]
MGSLIDTSIFIEAERGRLDLDAEMNSFENEEFFMSVITASELLHGVNRASSIYRNARASTIEGWIGKFALLDVDLPIAREHAQIYAGLRSSGKTIGSHDLWLAATCLSRGLKMVTANVREFERVPGLTVENWSSTRSERG